MSNARIAKRVRGGFDFNFNYWLKACRHLQLSVHSLWLELTALWEYSVNVLFCECFVLANCSTTKTLRVWHDCRGDQHARCTYRTPPHENLATRPTDFMTLLSEG